MYKRLVVLIFLMSNAAALSLLAGDQSVYERGQGSSHVRGNRLRQKSAQPSSQSTRKARKSTSLGQRTAWNKRSLGRQVNR